MWEQIHNPNFKPIEFDRFKAESGENAFTLTPQQWIEATDAIGIISKSGRYGGIKQFLRDYIKAIRDGNAAVFAGAGLSRPSGFDIENICFYRI